MNLLVFYGDAWDAESEVSALAGVTTHKVHGQISDLANCVKKYSPDVLLIGGLDYTNDFFGEIDKLNTFYQSQIILFQNEINADVLLNAMRSGVRDVLTSQTLGTLGEVIKKAASSHHRHAAHGKRQASLCQKIGLMSAKGGDGSTVLITNLATSLAQESETKVLLIDLSLPFGDADIYLSKEKIVADLSDFVREIDRLDKELIHNLVHHVSDRVDFIPSPSTFEKIFSLDAGNVSKLLDLLSANYSYILIDMGGVEPISLGILSKLDRLLMVLSPELPSIRRASQIMQLFEMENFEFPFSKISVLLNKYEDRSDYNTKDFESVLGMKFNYLVPNDAQGIRGSILNATPLTASVVKGPFVTAIKKIARDILGVATEDEKGSIWNRLKIK